MRVVLIALALLGVPAFAFAAASLPFLRAQGTRLVDEQTRRPVVLKGCNLGNWLMIEPWMLGGTIDGKDQVSIFGTLKTRFGEEPGQRLIELYRSNYITPRDFDLLKTFGFNVVRVPFDYRIIQEDEPPYRIRKDAFVHLDRALDMAQAAGVYVILDLHGTPGGNSNQMHTGQADQPGMWGDAICYKRTADIWREIARRYKDRAVVAAYDLVNEPYGDYKQDVRAELVKLMDQLYRAVREVDDRHLIYFSGALNGGIGFYGDPKTRGFHDVGFTEHFYAGLFGDKPVLQSHARDLNQVFPRKQAYAQRLGVPYLVGEFNVVHRAAGGNRLMREYYDRMGAYGWTATMWSYKLLKTDGGARPDVWYMATNASPLPKLDLQTASYEDLERLFAALATMELAVNEPLRKALTEPNPPPLSLAKFHELPSTAPSGSAPQGWTAVDIGGAMRGGVETGAEGTVTVYASGTDIFGTRDGFRFVSRPATSADDKLIAQVLSLLDSNTYAKAGVMARWGEEAADAAFAMVNVFPDGTIAFCGRAARGARATEKKIDHAATMPLELRVSVKSGRAVGSFREVDGSWTEIGSTDVPEDAKYRIGLALTSHDDTVLTAARFRVGEATTKSASPARQAAPPNSPASPAPPTSPSLLGNRAFDDWNHWGEWNRDDGFCRTTSRKYAGIWREVDAEPGKRYAFSVRAARTAPGGGGGGSDAGAAGDDDSVELRLEGTLADHQVTLNSNAFRAASLPANQASKLLTVSATAVGPKLRVLVISSPSADGPESAGVTFQTPMLLAE